MDTNDAIQSLSALAQESRLEAFRLVVRQGAHGMAAGDIARAIGVPHNTMSSHLSILTQAGLLTARRDGRSILYAVDIAGVRALISFLLRDCCHGHPEVCAPFFDALLTDDETLETADAKRARCG